MSKIWRANVATRTVTHEPVPPTWERLGGRGLSARILLDEVPPACSPLGPGNKLIFAPGLLVGHMLTSLDRISIGGKSPLTGGIKEANAGGTTGLQMACLGIHALIIEGSPAQEGWWVLYLSKDEARFDAAGDLAGLGVYAAAPKLVERYGAKVAVALIGPGGELKLSAAGIQNLDKEHIPSRIAARGGLGAVMGSKGLKAVVFDAAGCEKPPIASPEAFKLAQKDFTQAVFDHPQSATFRDYGTAANVAMINYLGALPTRNFSRGDFETAEAISGEHLRDLLLERGGDASTTHACMPGCTIRCSNNYAGEDGREIVSPLEYETIGLMGSNLGIGDLDAIARLNWQVNDLGLDSIEIGSALGVAAEAGLYKFGDVPAALRLLDEIRQGTPTGRILGSGAALAGKVLGVERVAAVKGQAMSAYDPRAIKGTGVTYATTPMGADHTCGLTFRAKIDHTDPKGQVTVSRNAQINMAGYDTLGACLFAAFGFGNTPDTISRLLNARYGWETGTGILQEFGRQTIDMEREFNRQAGFTSAHDRLPEWMTREPLAPKNLVFDVDEQEMDAMWEA